jgi:DNA-binding response OmpR family regulator
MVNPVVLAVDDEPAILRLLKVDLSTLGFRVLTASSGEEALKLVPEERPDVVLLDLMMPGMSGHDVLRRLSLATTCDPAVILLTARDTEQERVRGLEMGADDYVVKPFSPEELAARIRAVLRRSVRGQSKERIVRASNLEIDLERRVVTKNGEAVALSRTEWMLLQELAVNPRRVLLSSELLTRVWGPDYRGDMQYLRVWVSRLRAKVDSKDRKERIIKTHPGIGYSFEADASAS